MRVFFLVALLTFAIPGSRALAVHQAPCVDTLPLPPDLAATRQAICEMVNTQRALNEEEPVSLDARLSFIAQTFANDMAKRNYFSHTSPDGHDLDWRLREIHFTSLAGENIAWGYKKPVDVMLGWMTSEGHRKNIMQPKFTRLGVGYSHLYWVQVFTD